MWIQTQAISCMLRESLWNYHCLNFGIGNNYMTDSYSGFNTVSQLKLLLVLFKGYHISYGLATSCRHCGLIFVSISHFIIVIIYNIENIYTAWWMGYWKKEWVCSRDGWSRLKLKRGCGGGGLSQKNKLRREMVAKFRGMASDQVDL